MGGVSQHALGQTSPWADISQHALGQTPPGQTLPRQTSPRQIATAEDGTLPTGMHSCFDNSIAFTCASYNTLNYYQSWNASKMFFLEIIMLQMNWVFPIWGAQVFLQARESWLFQHKRISVWYQKNSRGKKLDLQRDYQTISGLPVNWDTTVVPGV